MWGKPKPTIATKRIAIVCAFLLLSACSGKPSEPASPDLPSQADRWVQTLDAQPDTKVGYVGRTSPVLSSTTVRDVAGVRSVKIGDTIEGVTVGAIKCTFFPHDASENTGQYMWRGRWGCMAGRDRNEVENAVRDDGTKAFDYIYLAPVSI